MKIGELFIELGLKDADFGKGMRGGQSGVQQLQQASCPRERRCWSAPWCAGSRRRPLQLQRSALPPSRWAPSLSRRSAPAGAIAEATEQGFTSLEGKARQLGATTMFSAPLPATAMQDLARAGLSVNEAWTPAVPRSCWLASAGASMGQATAITAATLAQFVPAGQRRRTRVSDVFSTALRKSCSTWTA